MDDRTLYAGDLTTDQLGKKVRVDVGAGTVIEDELAEVRYWRDVTDFQGARVWIKFKNVAPGDAISMQMFEGRLGFFIKPNDHVTVVS